jgi:hypothetical protein
MADDFCIIHGYEHMRSQIGHPIPFCQACEDRRCEKCGCATNGEEAYIDGKIWCHPCADKL